MSIFGVILVRIFPQFVRMRENADQNNSQFGHFLLSDLMVDSKTGLFLSEDTNVLKYHYWFEMTVNVPWNFKS